MQHAEDGIPARLILRIFEVCFEASINTNSSEEHDGIDTDARESFILILQQLLHQYETHREYLLDSQGNYEPMIRGSIPHLCDGVASPDPKTREQREAMTRDLAMNMIERALLLSHVEGVFTVWNRHAGVSVQFAEELAHAFEPISRGQLETNILLLLLMLCKTAIKVNGEAHFYSPFFIIDYHVPNFYLL